MDAPIFKQRQQDQSTGFAREVPSQPLTPNVGFSERLVKPPATAPPTGSPTLAPKPDYRYRPEDDIKVQPLTQSGYPETPRTTNPSLLPPAPSIPSLKAHTLGLNDLPLEIHGAIIDHLAGMLAPLSPPKARLSERDWNSSLRHPRRKQLSDLALVSRIWTPLIQERVYRHSK